MSGLPKLLLYDGMHIPGTHNSLADPLSHEQAAYIQGVDNTLADSSSQ